MQKITVDRGRATGVVLEDGSELAARTVISGCEPRLTFQRFVGEENLPDDFAQSIRRYKCRM